MTLKIYTKSGDQGETGLFFGGRVPKSDARCEAYGEADSVVSYMGLARALCLDKDNKELLLHIQNRMFTVGAELATLPENHEKLTDHYHTIDSEMITELEKYIDKLSDSVDLPSDFIVSGASPGSAALDVARTGVRTLERRLVALDSDSMLVNGEMLKFVNRLSDLLFMMARYEDRDISPEVITGQRISDDE
ncbi:MAG: cob(I)yrinic acid a,c-diamide adenosyltransferase [SAR202 cluster bacterium]|nr:cob(I)yrinic acid a,c-diamide adenosyltransferase [SAR202 cluster bacterium]